MTAHEIAGALNNYRLRFISEKHLQDAFAEICWREGWSDVLREHRLGASDVPDFFFPGDGLVVEIKVAGGVSEVERQLARYAIHPEVKSIMLLTSRHIHANVAARIAGKPVHVHCARRRIQ